LSLHVDDARRVLALADAIADRAKVLSTRHPVVG
jgi:hypothetical protein